jgi:hypothetical protein
MRAQGWAVFAVGTIVLAATLAGFGSILATHANAAVVPVASSLPTAASRSNSYNWAGYAGTGPDHTVTRVSGNWVAPSVTCAKSPTYLAIWVGIDGFSTTDLVQTGTGTACTGGVASYYAWWEVLPAPETVISSIPVHPGDKITASVTYSGSTHKFTMSITDGTHSFSKTEAVSSTPRNSAECIVERPLVGGSFSSLAKFVTATFSSCTATIKAISSGIGSSPSVYEIFMYNNAGTKVIAYPSSLTSGKAFHVTWKGYG